MALFSIFGKDTALADGQPSRWLFNFDFLRDPLQDIEPRPDGVRGTGQWVDRARDGFRADRIAYHTAYCGWQHQDPGQHDYVTAIRFFVQGYGNSDRCQILDRGMEENPFNVEVGESQGFAPYAYEVEPANPITRTRPSPVVVEFLHKRPAPNRVQVLQRFVIPQPPHALQNPGVRWYYELNGLLVAEAPQIGIFAKIVLSAMHPAYSWRVQGVETRGFA